MFWGYNQIWYISTTWKLIPSFFLICAWNSEHLLHMLLLLTCNKRHLQEESFKEHWKMKGSTLITQRMFVIIASTLMRTPRNPTASVYGKEVKEWQSSHRREYTRTVWSPQEEPGWTDMKHVKHRGGRVRSVGVCALLCCRLSAWY